MKKIKLLTVLSSLSVVGVAIAPLTSCNKNSDTGPVKPQDGKSKDSDNGTTSYSFKFDNKPDDGKANVLLTNQSSENKVQFITNSNDTTSTTITVGNDLTANIKVVFVVLPTTSCETKFNLTFTYKVNGADVVAEVKDCVLKYTPSTSKCTITVQAGEHGSVDKTSIEVPKNCIWGSIKSYVTTTPNKGYHFKEWQKDGYAIDDNYLIVSDFIVKAVFEVDPPKTFTISTSGSSQGVTFNNLPEKATEGVAITATYTFDNAQMQLVESECDILVGTKSIKEWCSKWKEGQINIAASLVTDNITIKIVTEYKTGHLNQTWNEIITACNNFEAGSITEAQFLASFSAKGKTITTLNDLVDCWTSILINGKQHVVRIIGSGHDKVVNQSYKAALTFELVTILSGSDGNALQCKWDSANTFNFVNSILMKNLNGTGTATGSDVWTTPAIDMLPSDIKTAIKTVTKTVGTSADSGTTYTATDYDTKLFPLTYSEVGQTHSESSTWLEEGKVYDYWNIFKEHNPQFKKYDVNGNIQYYWLTTPQTDATNLVGYVHSNGSTYFCSAASSHSVSFAFCI